MGPARRPGHGRAGRGWRTPAGAAWIRTYTADEPGYAFVDESVPELAIACVPGERGRGLGHRLVDAVLDQAAAAGSEAVSLSVRRSNPAAQVVYRDCGFVEPAAPPLDDHGGGSIVLVAATDRSRRPPVVEVTPLAHAADAVGWSFADTWGETVVSRGRTWRLADLPAFLASIDGEPVGMAMWSVGGDECELVSIDAAVRDRGVGTALLRAVRRAAADAGCRRLWLVTTNDNTPALRFYQRRGWVLVAVHFGAVDAAAADQALDPAPRRRRHPDPRRARARVSVAAVRSVRGLTAAARCEEGRAPGGTRPRHPAAIAHCATPSSGAVGETVEIDQAMVLAEAARSAGRVSSSASVMPNGQVARASTRPALASSWVTVTSSPTRH